MGKDDDNSHGGSHRMPHLIVRIAIGCILLLLYTGDKIAIQHILGPLGPTQSPTTAGARRFVMARGGSDDGSVSTASAWLRALARRAQRHWEQLHSSGHRQRLVGDIRSAARRANDWRKQIPYNEVLLTALATTIFISGLRRGLKRYRTATEIPLDQYRNGRRLKGCIVSVNDSDNLRFYHRRPLSLPLSTPSIDRQQLKYETINVRLAGIDAPEMAHFGGPAQPYSAEAKQWLTEYAQGRRASIQIHRLDQYSRAVATVHVWRYGLFRRNVSLAMVEAGFATVYNSAGAEYGGIKEQLAEAEKRARKQRIGMWKQPIGDYVSPADHKRQQRNGGGNGSGATVQKERWWS